MPVVTIAQRVRAVAAVLQSVLPSVTVIAPACLMTVTGLITAMPGTAAAGAGPAHVVSVHVVSAHRVSAEVFSAAMSRVVTVNVLLGPTGDRPRPTVYALDGISAGTTSGFTESDWLGQTDIERFMSGKQTTVVFPVGGPASYYTDWRRDDPVLGRMRWETFLTRELPPLIDRRFHGNGTNALLGLSMGATAASVLQMRHPHLYSGGAYFSGCPDLGVPTAQQATMATIATRLGDPENMWGPPGSPAWLDHDPSAHPEAFAGKPVYVAVGDGNYDLSLGIRALADPAGVVIERAANYCTRLFQSAIEGAGVTSVSFHYGLGVHAWGYWERDLHQAWPTLRAALGLDAHDRVLSSAHPTSG